MKRIYFILIGVVILALIIASATYLIKKSPLTIFPDEILPSLDLSLGKLKIVSVGDNAFGSLKADNADSGANGLGAADSRAGSSLEQSSALPTSEIKMIGGGGGGGMAVGMPNPFSVRYNFIYMGGDFEISDSQQPVLKRVKDDSLSKNFAKTISSLNFGLFNSAKFKNQELANFNINEDREFGYSLYFNLAENMINISTNWSKWPRPEAKCEGLAGEDNVKCYESYRLKEEDLLPDETVLAVADDFIKEYNVDMSSYGPGEIQKSWLLNYGLAGSQEMAYVPESITIIYPLLINGQTVYDESGAKTGLAIDVNIRHNRVSGVSNIIPQNYQSSDYGAETDSGRIIKVAQIGGYNRIYNDPDAQKTVDIELGAPSLELVKIWKYDRTTGQGYELLTPFYVFPIIKMPEDVYLWQKNIIVPAAQEMLDEIEQRDDVFILRPIPEPMMLEEEADVSASE